MSIADAFNRIRYSLSEPSHEDLQAIFNGLPFDATRGRDDASLHQHRAALADALQDKGREGEGLLAADPSKHLLVHWEPDSGFSLSEQHFDGHPDRGNVHAYQNGPIPAGDYLNTALFASTYSAGSDDDEDQDGDPLDRYFSPYHFTPNSIALAHHDITKFRSGLSPEALAEYDSRSGNDNDDDAEHHLWLTRNHHGNGFWNGEWENGDELTKKAHALGEQYVHHTPVDLDDPDPDRSLHLERG